MLLSNKFNCVVMGDDTLLLQCSEMLLERGHRIVGVVTTSEAVESWARRHDCAVLDAQGDLETSTVTLDYDWFFSIANLRIVPRSVWGKARVGAANFHDGPLPHYAGLNAPVWALLAGEHEYGITWHAMTDGIDAGGIYVQKRFSVDADDSALSLNTKCFEAGIDAFGELLSLAEKGEAVARPQPSAARHEFRRSDRPTGAGTLDFSQTTEAIVRTARALDHGPGYRNPVALPKVLAGGRAVAVAGVRAHNTTTPAASGTIVSVSEEGAVVATADGAVLVSSVVAEDGTLKPASGILKPFDRLESLDPGRAEDLRIVASDLARHEPFFASRLKKAQDPDILPSRIAGEVQETGQTAVHLPARVADGPTGVAAVAAWAARSSAAGRFDIAFRSDDIAQLCATYPGYFAGHVPMSVSMLDGDTQTAFFDRIAAELSDLANRRTFSADLAARSPGLKPLRSSLGIVLATDPASAAALDGCAITVVVPVQGGALCAIVDRTKVADADARAMLHRLATAVASYDPASPAPLADVALMTEAERRVVLFDWNRSARAYDRSATVHALFERQVDATPSAVALVCGSDALTYAELDREANRVANTLIGLGVGPDKLVGLHVRRSLDLVIGALGVLKAGGAYVPLDPTYPGDRLALMVEDSGLEVLVTQEDAVDEVPSKAPRIVAIEAARTSVDATRPQGRAAPADLAYVIYTSGSTGRPKGVMVEHRNVVNFFAGMDDRIPVDRSSQPVWLAVTSLSFDISVLELFWTLQRGFKVVVHADKRQAPVPRTPRQARRQPGGMDFSLYYWGNDDGAGPRKYHVLLEGAKFADQHGFRAVWTPERHFHAFGGPYPNPSVTGAAVAAVTRNLDIRAGSCVLPLHHPARVAEEWAVIDNISNGRAGLAIASGWMPEDFVLRPENAPPNNKASMLRDIDVLRRLWRGDAVPFAMADGKMVDVRTQPRPVQAELPLWVTTAGNPETYREAARIGANVLTHLLGQSIEEVAQKIKIYRETLLETGRNPDDFQVTLMLHTLIGEDREEVRDLARKPMKDYLRSAAALIKQYAWAFPAFKKPQNAAQPLDIDLGTLTPEELDDILEFAFLRYFEDSGLFGTVEDALARVEQLKAIGVTEVACLIDFGLQAERVLKALKPLAAVVGRANPVPTEADEDYGIGAQIRRHGVTHLQCTPSMATMIMLSEEDKAALGQVRHLFIGGEALQSSLLREIRTVSSASIENMYGPTETTIWSSTQPANDADKVVPLGKPIANTQLYVLDTLRRPVPPGLQGELYIGGEGVTRGYLNRDDLTSERFLPDPFVSGNRMYRTGDLVRFDEHGTLHFLGRADHQVKVRGYRIELGEIESALGTHPDIAEAVVVVREDSAHDARIVAYLRVRKDPVDAADMRTYLRRTLPDFMVPSHFVTLQSFPLTPNAKVDRKALPSPEDVSQPVSAPVVSAPVEASVGGSEMAVQIADIFRRFLGVPAVQPTDNFFALGGHSLLAVQVHREIKAKLVADVTIADIFRFPTVKGLSEHLANRGKASSALGRVADRAQMRRNAIAGRRGA
jgi:natural product biosynthesis luciferase-like monooxygenase protein